MLFLLNNKQKYLNLKTDRHCSLSFNFSSRSFASNLINVETEITNLINKQVNGKEWGVVKKIVLEQSCSLINGSFDLVSSVKCTSENKGKEENNGNNGDCSSDDCFLRFFIGSLTL